ncbi:protein neuralized isoform X2 [Folsomia candida]|uniref:protein neuralized isoform X2 n=1 Tax=Folsomia candida TaxID=158441 RepID=UPI000B908284|nr:protein neuralized isoform X2 [Folsomia candida]
MGLYTSESYMASNYSSSYITHPLKSNCSPSYGSIGNNMGVLVTGPWPMSQQTSSASYATLNSKGSSSTYESSCRQRRASYHQGHNHLRPISMPTSSSSNRDSTCCRYESAIEMVPLNINAGGVVVPCRNGGAGDGGMMMMSNPTSPPTCVPWLKKMKVIKKIQRKIGIGLRSGGMSPNNMPPLLFNNVHGENVSISGNGFVARRTNSFCKAIAFSDRPVKVAEKVCIKFVEVSTNWNGVLRIGFTSHDPSSLRSGLPKYVCPDLTSRPGFWAKAFSDFFVKKDSVLFYYTTSAGDVHFGINGEEKGVFFTGVDTRGPLWAMLDIYGNTTCVEFVDPRAHLNNSRRCVNDLATSSRDEIESSMCDIVPAMNGLKLIESSMPEVPCFPNVDIEELNFHRVRGKNVMHTADSLPSIALRRPSEYCNAYVFTARPIMPDETILIQILHKELEFSSSMAFGLTACNPQSVYSDSLPEDSHLLLDRPEYWVVKKDIANNPVAKDILAFTLSATGEVTMSVNGGPAVFQMHVDNSVPLWAFFDLYGTTDRIRCIGSIKRNNAQPPRGVQLRRNKESSSSSSSLGMRASSNKCASTSNNSQISASNNFPSPLPSTSASTLFATREYFELSQSPNSMKTSTALNRTYSVYESLTSGSQSLKEMSNYSVECVACCERPVDSVFYSCGHMCMCYNCAVEYWKSKEKGCCPICRATISDVIRTYKS